MRFEAAASSSMAKATIAFTTDEEAATPKRMELYVFSAQN